MSQPEQTTEIGFTDIADCELIIIEGGGDTTVRPTDRASVRKLNMECVDGKHHLRNLRAIVRSRRTARPPHEPFAEDCAWRSAKLSRRRIPCTVTEGLQLSSAFGSVIMSSHLLVSGLLHRCRCAFLLAVCLGLILSGLSATRLHASWPNVSKRRFRWGRRATLGS